MKKIIVFVALLSVALFSCDREEVEEIFNTSPEERVSEKLSAFRTSLINHKEGWFTTYTYDKGMKDIVLILKFLENGRVEITVPSENYKKESAYSLNYTQQIDLVFDTHNYFSTLVDKGDKGDFRWEQENEEDGKFFFKSRASKNVGESKLVLEKVTPEKLKSALDIQAMKIKMKGDPLKSVFRNLVIEGSTEKYAYTFQPGKVQFSTVKSGKVVTIESDVTVNEKGFTLDKPLKFGKVSLKSFNYSEDENAFFVSKGAKIIYDLVPVLPLAPYKFGEDNLGFFNTLDSKDKSSLAFSNFYKTYKEWTIEKHKTKIVNWLFADLVPGKGKKPNFRILFNYNNGKTLYGARYYFTYKLKGGKVYFTLTGELDKFGNAKFLDAAFQPLVKKIFNKNGHFIESSGKLEKFTNKTFSLINADDPSLKINCYGQ